MNSVSGVFPVFKGALDRNPLSVLVQVPEERPGEHAPRARRQGGRGDEAEAVPAEGAVRMHALRSCISLRSMDLTTSMKREA